MRYTIQFGYSSLAITQIIIFSNFLQVKFEIFENFGIYKKTILIFYPPQSHSFHILRYKTSISPVLICQKHHQLIKTNCLQPPQFSISFQVKNFSYSSQFFYNTNHQRLITIFPTSTFTGKKYL